MPQEQLGAIVRDKLPQMMQAAGVPAPDVADNFFGESEAFGAAPGAAHPAPPGPVGQYGAYPDDLVPMGVPKSGNFGLLLAFAVGGIALLLGVVIVVVLFR